MSDSKGGRVSVGLIGCGRVVERFHLPALEGLPAVEIVGAAEPLPVRRDWIRAQLPGLPTFETSEEMLRSVRPKAVLVAVPPAQQVEVALQALGHGCDVLLEKPGGAAAEGLKRLAVRREVSTHVKIGFNRRYMSNYRRLRQHLEAVREPATLVGEYQLRLDPQAWAPVSGPPAGSALSSVLLDVVPHQIDALMWLVPDEIQSLELLENGPQEGETGLRYRVSFGAGGSVDCTATHGTGYCERIGLTWNGGACALYPTGVLSSLAASSRWREPTLDLLTWLDRKWIRMGLKADVMANSFRDQWQAFLNPVHGGSPGELHCGPPVALRVHGWLSELAAGLEVGGPAARRETTG